MYKFLAQDNKLSEIRKTIGSGQPPGFMLQPVLDLARGIADEFYCCLFHRGEETAPFGAILSISSWLVLLVFARTGEGAPMVHPGLQFIRLCLCSLPSYTPRTVPPALLGENPENFDSAIVVTLFVAPPPPPTGRVPPPSGGG